MSKELKVGLIALISGVVLYYGFNYLKGIDFFSPTNKFYAIYEKVDGLSKSNPVIINGLHVGRVSDIQLLQDAENSILVELDIDEDIVLGDSSEAHLSNIDFLGSKGVIISLRNPEFPLEPGDTLISIIDGGIIEIVDPVANNLNVTITRINEILLGLKGSGEKVNSALDTLQSTMSEVRSFLAVNKYSIKGTLDSLGMVAGTVSRQVDGLDPVIERTNAVLDTLAALELKKTLASVESVLGTLDETLKFLSSDKGTLGKLITTDSLHNNLNKVLDDLDKLLIHMDRYPKDFFSPLGRKHNKLEGKEGD